MDEVDAAALLRRSIQDRYCRISFSAFPPHDTCSTRLHLLLVTCGFVQQTRYQNLQVKIKKRQSELMPCNGKVALDRRTKLMLQG